MGATANVRRSVVLGLTGAILGLALLGSAGPAAASAGPPWSDVYPCPVDDPAMLAVPAGQGVQCVDASTWIHVNLGKSKSSLWSTGLDFGVAGITPTSLGNVVTRGQQYIFGDYINVGAVVPGFDACNVLFPYLSPGWAQCEHSNTGNLGYLPGELTSDVLSLNAVLQWAGPPSDFDASALTQPGHHALTLRVKFRIVGNLLTGPDCTIGTDANPIVLHLSTTSPPTSSSSATDPNGYPVSFTSASGTVLSDTSFSEPGATGCGTGGLMNPVVNALAGLPKKTGNNFTMTLQTNVASTTAGGAVMSQAWHAAFG